MTGGLIEPQTSNGLPLNDVSNQRLYTLDVRLFTYSAANLGDAIQPKEFTGINTLSVDYLKNNIGFGITNIDISINASLQPVIEISFKDLYGNTVFSRVKSSNNPNFSDIFDWPPPKFDLIYKGYLGKPTRLMLNLKKSDIQYNSSDGSFTIKCSFVPNTWGPFADIPGLFLYSIKKLKLDERQVNFVEEPVTTFFDIIKIGKQVDTVRKSFNEQYSELKKKLSEVRGSLSLSFSTSEMKPGTEIKGTIQSSQESIEGFKTINVYDFTGKDDFKDVKDLKDSSVSPILLSEYFLSKTSIEGTSNFEGNLQTFLRIKSTTGATDFFSNDAERDRQRILDNEKQKLRDIYNAKITEIDKNITLVDEVVNAESFAQVEKQIAATTISQVFKFLAGDTGYLLGRILRAGFLGYENNKKSRDEKKELIGKFYPLIIEDQDDNNVKNSQKIPKEKEFFINSTNEIIFIEEFIQAIAFGLAEFASLEEPLDTKGRRQLVRRISNLEVLQSNPYFPTYNSIIENMVVRSGIYAYFTNSDEPNTPGDYYQALSNFNRDGDDSIQKAAKGELENLTDALIKQIPPDDVSKLRDSLNYFRNAFTENSNSIKADTSVNIQNKVGSPLTKNFKDIVAEIDLVSKGIPSNFTSTKLVYNNNLPWANIDGKKYKFVLFTSNSDVNYIKNVNSAPKDSEFKSSQYQEKSSVLGVARTDEPPGLVVIDGFANKGEQGFGKITYLNKFIKNGQVIDYEKLQKQYENYLSDRTPVNINTCVIDSDSTVSVNTNFPIAYSIYSAEEGSENLAWNLFGSDSQSLIQKKFLRYLSAELILKLDKVDEEKQNQIATVGAKANELKNSIYIQMHHIFYQWCSLLFNYETDNSSANNAQQLYKFKDLPINLESLYNSIGTENNKDIESGFQYLAPLIKYGKENEPIDVEDSIINLESCYSIDANTTVLNVMQNICNKNNFLFFPLAGGNVFDLESMFTPQLVTSIPKPGNRFVILWAPTPEARVKDKNGDDLAFIQDKKDVKQSGFLVKFGSTDNALFKNVRVGSDSTKTTAESIVNLQRLVDKQVDNKQVTRDCSTIPVLEGRSYTCEIDTLGNAQISPMQFFYIDNMPIFGGLYQIMEVHHTITPNNFETKFKGIKTRYNSGKSGGIPPVTLKTSRDLAQKYKITGGTTKDLFSISEINQKILSGLGFPTTGNPPLQGYLTPGNLKLSENGFNLIKRGEGSRNQVYDDKTGKGITSYSELSGFPTIGIGHLITESERGKYSIYLKGKQKMSDKEIQDLFLNDIKPREKALNNLLKKPITQNMFDSLMSLLYNAGAGNDFFKRAIKYVNNEQYKDAADQIRLGPKTSKGVILAGLAKRRIEESDLFLA